MDASATEICNSPSDRFRRHSSRTMTGKCRSLPRTRQGENMPILLKIQVERTAKTPIQARRARVGGLCDFQDTVERVPTGSTKTGRCADVRECCRNGKRRKRTDAGRFWQMEKPQAARQDKATGSCAPRGGHICPPCGQFRGFAKGLLRGQK